MKQITVSKLIKLSEERAGLQIYPAATMLDKAALDRFSMQNDLLKCNDFDCLLKGVNYEKDTIDIVINCIRD